MSRKFVSLTALGLLLVVTGSAGAQIGSAGWRAERVGDGVDGSVSVADTTYTVIGDGHDIWDNSDGFQYMYKELIGDGSMTARVVSIGPGSNTWAKAGVMIRQNNTGPSQHAMTAITANTDGSAGNGASFQRRVANGGGGSNADSGSVVAAPYWTRIVRTGNSFTGFISADGTTWTQLGSAVTVTMTDPVLIGLCATSHAAGELRTMTFDNVNFTGNVRDWAPRASSPVPANGEVDVTSPLFQWTAGLGALTHEVYFGTNPNPGAAELVGVQPIAMYFHIPGLTPGATYYWRVDETDAAGVKTVGDVWSFIVMPLTAHAPSPKDGALLKGTGPAPKLSWTAGQTGVSRNVYFGTDKAKVTAADASTAVGKAQAETTFDPGALEPLTTYYWKVDEVDAAGAVQAGAVWNFRITDKATDMNTDNWAVGIATAGPKYVATYVTNGTYDIGTFGDEMTYEFVVRCNPAETMTSLALIGRMDFGATKVGLKYEQWENTKTYGATAFGVMDYDYRVPNAPGEYTHLAFVASKAAGATDLYVNGVLKGSVPVVAVLSGSVGIGRAIRANGTFVDNFDGDIFGVAIYDMLLTAEQIAANADKYFNPIAITDPDLLIHYDFETGSGTLAIDQSGHSNHGMFMGSPKWVTGLFGGCVSIDIATLDYIQTAVPLNIKTNTVSVTGWVKHDKLPAGWSGILTHRGTSPGCLGLQHDGTELRYMWGADVYWSFSSGLKLPNGEWYFAALAISPTQGKLYLNGIDKTATNVAPHEPTNFDSLIRVGRDHNDGRIMTSLIDEVRFYQKTLTDVDIQRFVLADVTAPGDAVQGVPNDGVGPGWPANEHPALAIDNNVNTKFLHFKGGKLPTGIQVTPAVGSTIVTGLTFTTANDDYGRDPVKFELSGSNDGINGPWTVIAAGDVVDFAQATLWPRFTMNATAISFANTVEYKHYQLLFPALRDPAAGTLMQIAEVELLGVVTQPPSLLVNGNFETGALEPWGAWGGGGQTATAAVVKDCAGAAVAEGPIEGSYCLNVKVSGPSTNFWDCAFNIAPPTFEKGKKYTLSAFFKVASGTGKINMKPEHGAANWEGYGEKQVTITDKWAEYYVTTPVFESDVKPTSLTFHIGFQAQEFWVDDVRWYEGDYVPSR